MTCSSLTETQRRFDVNQAHFVLMLLFNTGGCQAHFHIDIKSKINHLALFPFKENSKNLVAVQISKKLSLKRAAARL